jgi:hypothetical protein
VPAFEGLAVHTVGGLVFHGEIQMRRTLLPLAVAGLALTAVFPVSGASAVSTGSPWSQEGGRASGNPYNSGEATLTASTITHATLLRTLKDTVRTTDGCLGPSTPLVTESQVWNTDQTHITEWSRSTGARIRQIKFPDPGSWRGIAIQGHVLIGYVFGCGSASDPDGLVAAFNTSTGKQLWSFDAPAATGGGVSPALIHNEVIVTGATMGSGRVIAALNLSTGKKLWEHTADNTDLSLESVVAGNRVITFTDGGTGATDNRVTLRALNLTTGKVIWTHHAAQDTTGDLDFADTPVGGSAQVYVEVNHNNSSETNVYSSETGKFLYELGGAPTPVDQAPHPLAADSHNVFGSCSGTPDSLCAYSKTSGALVWGPVDVSGASTVSVAGGLLYLSTGAVLQAQNGATVDQLFEAGTSTDSNASVRISIGFGTAARDVGTSVQLYGVKS